MGHKKKYTCCSPCQPVCGVCYSYPCCCPPQCPPPSYCPPNPCCPPPCPPPACCPPACPPPCPQGATGPKGDGVLSNANGAISVGVGASVPLLSGKGAIAVGPLAGIASQGLNAIAIGYLSASAAAQPANSVILNASGGAAVPAANAVVIKTSTAAVNPTPGGFSVDCVTDVVGVANMRYNSASGLITFDSTI